MKVWGLQSADLKINLKNRIKPKEFPCAFEMTKSQHQRSDRTGSVLLCQTDHKIKFMLFLSVNQDSCVRAEKNLVESYVRGEDLEIKEWKRSSWIVFLWSFICKEAPGEMNLYPIPVWESSTITLFLWLNIFLFTVMLWLVVSTWCLWIK